jgi:hypothetical protein
MSEYPFHVTLTNRIRRFWEQHPTWTAILVTGLLVAACYGFALRLPFFFDGPPTMTLLERQSWADVWTMLDDRAYFRPLVDSVYKAGLLLPQGTRQVALEATNLFLHWLNGVLVMQIVILSAERGSAGKRAGQGLLAAALFVVFPFMFFAVPCYAAMYHQMVLAWTLLAAFAALKAEEGEQIAWWGISLAATALAPLAHESGFVCSVIVAGIVVIRHGLHRSDAGLRRRLIAIALGVALNVGYFLFRSTTHSVRETSFAGLVDWFQNAMFFLHGLVYPVAPLIGRLVQQLGLRDFTLVEIATVLLGTLLVWLVLRSRDWRPVATGLWWWLWAALPAATSLRYGGLYISPRLYVLPSAGIVMLWACVILELGKVVRSEWASRAIRALLASAILIQSLVFLQRQRVLFTLLDDVYDRVLEAAEETNGPLGLVNLPSYLAWPDKTHALIQETVTFIPPYSSVEEFIQANAEWSKVDVVTFAPVLEETAHHFGLRWPGLDWQEMRRFAIEHRAVWLAQYRDGRHALNHVGRVAPGAVLSSELPVVSFQSNAVIESASARRVPDGHWTVTLVWLAPGPVEAEIFVHVRDANGQLVAQADGPALEGLVPPWVWEMDDRIYDVRHLPPLEGPAPYTVQVGMYDAAGRHPAFLMDGRCPDDAATVVTLNP